VLIGTFAPSLVALWLTARTEGDSGVRALLGGVLNWQVRRAGTCSPWPTFPPSS